MARELTKTLNKEVLCILNRALYVTGGVLPSRVFFLLPFLCGYEDSVKIRNFTDGGRGGSLIPPTKHIMSSSKPTSRALEQVVWYTFEAIISLCKSYACRS